MSYASRIKIKKLSGGGTVAFAAFPAHGEVSIVGSVAGGAHLAQRFVCEGVEECTLSGDVLADMHAALLMDGTDKRTKDEIQILLDTWGASLSFTADKLRLVWHARVRAVHADKLLGLIAECLRVPTFPHEELDHLKARMAADLSLEAQNTHEQSVISFSRMLYPYGHPNRQESTELSQKAAAQMTREELRQYHARCIDRRSLVVGISGDMRRDDAFALVEKHFGRLPVSDLALAPYLSITGAPAQRVAVHIPDKASIDYIVGSTLGITKDAPDYPALILGLQILGDRNGFSGRLMKTVREAEGLTYGVYAMTGGFTYGTDGYAQVWATFAPELFARGRASIMREVRALLADGPTTVEVRRHRTMYAARSRVACANSGALSQIAHDISVEGRHPAYLDEFPQRILRLTPARVHKALQKYLAPERFSEAAAGPIDSIE